MPKSKESYPKTYGISIVILIIIISYVLTNFYHQKWNSTKDYKGVIEWDVISYYSYLPAAIIYKDLSLSFTGQEGFEYKTKFWFVRADNGNKVILTTMGLSYLYAPFFFIAHLLAPFFGEARDGFGVIYEFFMVLSSLFYLWIAFVILAGILKRYFTNIATNIVLLLIGLGTNLYYYGTYEAAMSHAYSFSLIVLFLWLTIKWYEKPGFYSTIWLGLTYGLIVLIRPTNVLLLLILVLYGVRNLKEAGKRIRFLFSNRNWILLMIAAFLIPWIPQFIYWYTQTGQLFYNAYSKVGSAFYFDSPQITEVLFSFRKGWFIYVPVMSFAVLGFISLFRRKPELAPAIFLYIFIMTYVFSSWWSWWTGGSFGPRLFIDTYGLMAIPLAALVTDISKGKNIPMGLAMLSAGFLIYVNIFQSSQYFNGYLHYLGMTKESYKMQFLKQDFAKGYWKNLSIPDFELARQGIYYFYSTGEDFKSYQQLPAADAYAKTLEEIQSDAGLIKDIARMAKREEISKEEALKKVADRVHNTKTKGGPSY
ncbi:MAG: hypothetical protein IH594_05830 [Bacteroidales bacterium]|nr:hypothetical protein [Bacteroidales bacterium]